jgi:diketogulonate reductase-like aldo/keto reductase
MAKIPSLKLSKDLAMPIFGLGTWQSEPEKVKTAVRTALDLGYTNIDTAYLYGNEKEIGDVLKEYMDAGKVKRENLFITTKLWSTYFRRSDVMVSIKKSLERLQLKYLDLFLIHVPGGFERDETDNFKLDANGDVMPLKLDLMDTWKGMEDCYNAGLTKAIGLSNFNAKQVQYIHEHATIKPQNLQVECHLYFPQLELHDVCKKLGITFTAYAPIGSPGRVNFRIPGTVLDWGAELPKPMDDPIVKELSKKYKKTEAQVLLRYLIQRDIAVIPKSVTPSRIKENFEIFDFKLTEAEMKSLHEKSKNFNTRFFKQDFLKGHPNDPFADER